MRRQKIYWMDRRALWVLLTGWNCFMRPVLLGIPSDARNINLFFDWQRDAFAFVLEHESFEPLPDGEALPWAGELMVEFREPESAWAVQIEAENLYKRILETQEEADSCSLREANTDMK